MNRRSFCFGGVVGVLVGWVMGRSAKKAGAPRAVPFVSYVRRIYCPDGYDIVTYYHVRKEEADAVMQLIIQAGVEHSSGLRVPVKAWEYADGKPGYMVDCDYDLASPTAVIRASSRILTKWERLVWDLPALEVTVDT